MPAVCVLEQSRTTSKNVLRLSDTKTAQGAPIQPPTLCCDELQRRSVRLRSNSAIETSSLEAELELTKVKNQHQEAMADKELEKLRLQIELARVQGGSLRSSSGGAASSFLHFHPSCKACPQKPVARWRR
eukprot:scaffold2246_cov215-Pinguiococcus_pyrenoidosus.AAC.2